MGTHLSTASGRIVYVVRSTPHGALLVARSDRGLCAILLGDAAEPLVAELRRGFPDAVPADDLAEMAVAADQAQAALRVPSRPIDVELDLRGTEFQRRVWRALQAIPAGETLSYAQVAERVGAPGSARAVARACGANMLALAIPCHRVVRADGSLAGYRWGADRKRELLAREAA